MEEGNETTIISPPPPPDVQLPKENKIKMKDETVDLDKLASKQLAYSYFNTKNHKWEPYEDKKKRFFSSLFSRSAKKENTEHKSLKILTYNIYFHSNCFGLVRHPHLLELVRLEDPDIVGFQEVTKGFMDCLLKLQWVQDHYYISDTTGSTTNPYGCILLSKFPPIEMIQYEFPTHLYRSLILGKWQINNQVLVAGVVHLDSYPQDRPYRKKQLFVCSERMKDADTALLMGDFNFGDCVENEYFTNAGFEDLYRIRYSDNCDNVDDANGFTFDPTQNTMTEPYPRARLDRIIMRKKNDSNGGWSLKDIRIIGKDPLPTELWSEYSKNPLWPSDHFGLTCELTLSTTE